MYNRFFFEDDTTLSDETKTLENYHSGTLTKTWVADEDALYIGSRLPFNHLYIKMGGTVNDISSVLTVEYWDGTEFQTAVDLLDETSPSGKTFSQSGFVNFSPDKDYAWSKDDTENVTGLTTKKIYDLYWIKLTVSENLTASVIFSWIGQKFSDDNDIGTYYPDLLDSTLMGKFESGKSDWEEQHIAAASIIVQDLRAKGLIIERGQLVEREDLRLASVAKVAVIAYTPFDDDYSISLENAMKEYSHRINSYRPFIDEDLDGKADDNEMDYVQPTLQRR